jgi:3-phenylpropionate/cinnamic acid dioxygenase small subunit
MQIDSPRLGERFTAAGAWHALTSLAAFEGLDATPSELQSLILNETRLLDTDRLVEWLQLYDDDAAYWVPLVYRAETVRDSISLVYDDKRLMEDRVNRLLSGNVPSQDPPSRTVRILSQLLVAAPVQLPGGGTRECLIEAPVLIAEYRAGETNMYAGWFTYRVRETERGLLICGKKVQLLRSDARLPNITFIL